MMVAKQMSNLMILSSITTFLLKTVVRQWGKKPPLLSASRLILAGVGLS